jgi:SAM-dependent methyltransferase
VAPDRYDLTARAQDAHFWFRGFRRFLAPVLHRVTGGRPDPAIIDCGCGTGANLHLLSRYGRLTAVDLSEAALVYARRRGGRLLRGDITRLPFDDASFDLATSFDVCMMLPDDRVGLAEMARVLRPGGHVVVTVPAFEALRGPHSDAWEEQRRYSRGMVRRLAVAAGLAPLEVRYLFATLVPPLWVARRLQRLRGVHGAVEGRDRDMEVPTGLINAAMDALLAAEFGLARRVPMPWGSSVLLVARKDSGAEPTVRA